MQDTSSSNSSFIQEQQSSIMNRTISSSQLSSPRSHVSSTSKLINPNKLKIAEKPNLTERSFKRILTVTNLQDKSSHLNRTTNVSQEIKLKNQTSFRNQNQQMDNLLKKNQELSGREKLLAEQNKYLMKENEQLKKKLEAFNNIQVRIQNLQALNQVLEQRLKEKQGGQYERS